MEPGVAARFCYFCLNPCLSLLPSSCPLFKFTPSSLGKVWCVSRVCAADDCIYQCLHRNQSSRKENENTGYQSIRIPVLQFSFRFTSTWWNHTHLHNSKNPNPITQTSSTCAMFSLFSGEAVWSEPLRTWSDVRGGSWRLPMPLPTWMDRQDVPAGSVGPN